ncbi:MAG: SurA N-terminal domain-containing protein [Thiotrichales bacterium]|nr:SurA N-terminal domain-containing protein [Thiotrichales bacterium]
MLQAIRDRAQGWVAWVIIGLIIIVFALFGIEQYAQGDKTVTVAEVNGEAINSSEFLTLYNAQKLRLQQQFGDMYDTVVQDETLREQVLDALIESKLIQQWAESQSMLISDPQLAAAIQTAEVFQQEGAFSEKVYQDILQRNGFSVARFEYEQRQFLLEGQFKNLLMSSAFVTASEVEQLGQLQTQEREIAYLRVDQRPFLETVQISEEQIAQVYEKDKAQYVTPEQVKVDYLELSQADLAASITPTEEEISQFYQENQSLFTTPEQREASHILIRMQVGDEASEQKALQKIQEIQAKLKAGEDFAELAKTQSEDPGSAISGGELGRFEQGMMVPEFDQAVFSMQEGQISEPVKTEFGYHLIALKKILPQQIAPLEEVRSEALAQLKSQQAEKRYYELLETLTAQVYEQADSLAPAAEALGLQVKSSDFFSRSGGNDPIFAETKVIQAAFSDEVLRDNLNSTAIELPDNRAVALRLNRYEEERQKPLSDVADQIRQDLVREAAIAEAAKLAETLLQKLQSGEQPESLMQAGVEWQNVGWIDRNSQTLLPQMVSEAFKAPKPSSADARVWHRFQLSTGDTILLQLKGLRNQSLEPQARSALQEGYLQLTANAELSARIDALHAQADIEKKAIYQTLR